jgi:YD repeat-containing protein
VTTYSYYVDDTMQTMRDARGATTTYAYNHRHLPTAIEYGAPAGVAATANVSFSYDATGNC